MSEIKTPLLTVDAIITLIDDPKHPIVLIKRANPPHGYALPGGFVDVGETVEAAAVREAKEETGLTVTLDQLLGVYSDPARDPRGHTASVVYTATAEGSPLASDDACGILLLYPRDPLPEMAFDHAAILTDFRRLND